MKNIVLIVLLVAFSLVATGCIAGPYTCTNAIWDWSANVYAENTYVGTLLYIPVMWFGVGFGEIFDLVIFNNVAWWGSDVWDGTGTTYDHKDAPNGRTNEGGNKVMEQPQL